MCGPIVCVILGSETYAVMETGLETTKAVLLKGCVTVSCSQSSLLPAEVIRG